ncbi:MAG: hypothetical protein RRZ69_07040, partial [Clostridia bacterium]
MSDGQNFAEFATGENVLYLAIKGRVTQNVTNKNLELLLFGERGNLFDFFDLGRDGLFQQKIIAEIERLDCVAIMV